MNESWLAKSGWNRCPRRRGLAYAKALRQKMRFECLRWQKKVCVAVASRWGSRLNLRRQAGSQLWGIWQDMFIKILDLILFIKGSMVAKWYDFQVAVMEHGGHVGRMEVERLSRPYFGHQGKRWVWLWSVWGFFFMSAGQVLCVGSYCSYFDF